jgi:hypothetical protein
MANAILTKYGSKTTLTAALNSVASDTNLLSGVESSVIDNTSDGFTDILISGYWTSGTSPTASRQVEVWAIAWDGADFPDVFDGTTSAETITSSDIKNGICKAVAILSTNNTSDRTYYFSGASLREAFRGELPSKCVLFITHNTGVNSNSTAGNFELSYQGVYPEVQ